MWVWPLGQEDPLEEEMATHSSILAWRIPWTEEPGGLQSMGSYRVEPKWLSVKLGLKHFIANLCLFLWKRKQGKGRGRGNRCPSVVAAKMSWTDLAAKLSFSSFVGFHCKYVFGHNMRPEASVFWSGMEPTPPAVEVWSLSHWATREVCFACVFGV